MSILNVFDGEAFQVLNLSKVISEAPATPSRLAELGWFDADFQTTDTFAIERTASSMQLVPAAVPGSRGLVVGDDKRALTKISTTHLPQSGSIMATEVNGVRALGSETDVDTVMAKMRRLLSKMRRNIDVTMEYQRIGAVKGTILDADGSVLLDVRELLGQSEVTIDFELDNASTDVRQKCVDLRRAVEQALGVYVSRSVRVLVSPAFFDALVGHANVKEAYALWNQGAALRDDLRTGFILGGVLFEEYNANVNGQAFIAAGFGYAVPEGVPGLFGVTYSPANYMETVNTIALPYYAKQERMPFDKGVEVETQSNPIHYCTRPSAVIRVRAS